MLTKEQKEYVFKNSHLKPLTDIVKELGVPYFQVYNYVTKNKLSIIPSSYHISKEPYINQKQVDKVTNYKYLTDEQKKYIEKHAPDTTIRKISNDLGIKYRHVYEYCKGENIAFKSGMKDKKYSYEHGDGMFNVDAMPCWILGW